MKKEIHPKYYSNTKVTCSCGESFEIGSTIPELKVEICSRCHPAYTGNKKFIDTAGRLDKFKHRLEKTAKIKAELEKAKAKKEATKESPNKLEEKEQDDRPSS